MVANIEGLVGFTKRNRRSCEILAKTVAPKYSYALHRKFHSCACRINRINITERKGNIYIYYYQDCKFTGQEKLQK